MTGLVGASVAATAATALVTVTVIAAVLLSSGRPAQLDLILPAAPLELMTAVALVMATWISATRGAVTLGMLTLVIGTAVPVWQSFTPLPPLARAACGATATLGLAGAVHLGIRWRPAPSSSSSLGAATTTLRLTYGTTILAGVVQLAFLDPLSELECRRSCASIALASTRILDAHTALSIVAALQVAAAVIGTRALVSNLTSRGRDPVAIMGIAAACTAALAAVLRALAWLHGGFADLAIVLSPVAALALSTAVLLASLRAASTRRAVARMVEELAFSLPQGSTRPRSSALRHIDFAVPGTSQWVTDDGAIRSEPVAPTQYRFVRASDGAPVARIALAPHADAADVAASLTPAALLSLRNAQISAATKRRLAETRASRRRIVESSDAEARRIERDLHDGAQQRLVSASLYLSIATSAERTLAPMLEPARSSLHTALAQLRSIAHGIAPADLTMGSLSAALGEAIQISPASATLSVDLADPREDDNAALAAFAVAYTGIQAAAYAATPVQIHVRTIDGALRVVVELTGDRSGIDLVDVSDRVGALGGELEMRRSGGVTIIEAVIPCGS